MGRERSKSTQYGVNSTLEDYQRGATVRGAGGGAGGVKELLKEELI